MALERRSASRQVARAFSVYFSQLINQDNDVFQLKRANGITLDYIALVLILVMTCLCIYSTKVASEGNIGADANPSHAAQRVGMLSRATVSSRN